MQEDKETAWGTMIYTVLTFLALVIVQIMMWLTAMKFILFIGNALNYRAEPLIILYVIQVVLRIQVKTIINEVARRI